MGGEEKERVRERESERERREKGLRGGEKEKDLTATMIEIYSDNYTDSPAVISLAV